MYEVTGYQDTECFGITSHDNLLDALDFISDEIEQDRDQGLGMIDYVLTETATGAIVPYRVVAMLEN